VLTMAPAPLAAQEEAPRVVTLDEAIHLSLEQSRELQEARLGLASADARVREAWSAVYPSVSANASYTRNLDVPGQFLPAKFFDPNAPDGEQVLVRFGADNSWNGQLRLEQPLFQASAFIGVGAAGRYQSLQAETVRGKAQAIVTATRQVYHEALLARESVRLNAESVRRVREMLEETRAMNRAGLTGDYDVLRLEVELANLEPALRRAEDALRAARRGLAVQLALEDLESLEVSGSLAALRLGASADSAAASPLLRFGLEDPEGRTAEEVLELARSRRSDLRQLQLTEELRVAELRAEQAEYLPKVSLFANWSYFGQADGALNPFAVRGANGTTSPQVGLQVTVPVFSGFSRPARVAQKRAAVAQSDAQLRLARARVENQVKTLLDRVREAAERAGGTRWWRCCAPLRWARGWRGWRAT
jgi:outer membrane protein